MTAGAHILIVEAPYYADVSAELLKGAVAELEGAGATCERLTVPGAFEIPAAIGMAAGGVGADGRRFDAFVALGCVIRGETTHYDYVCEQSARGLMDLTVGDQLAIGYGIVTVENHEQAMERARVDRRNKGRDAAAAALRMLEIKRQFSGGGG